MIKPLRERRALVRPAWRRFSAFGDLSEADHLSLAEISSDPTTHRRGADLADGLTDGLHVITAGWACRMRRMQSGRRQIFLFLLPGDVIGSFHAQSDFSFFRCVALTRLETLEVSGLAAPDASPDIRTLVQAGLRAEDHSQGFLYGHMMRLGAGDAYCGMAHLLLELHDRLAQAGLLEVEGGFTLPIGQRVLAQALGVSVTHVNNTLQKMVADGLIAFSGRSLRIVQRERMTTLSNFEDVTSVVDDRLDDRLDDAEPTGSSLSNPALAKPSPPQAPLASGPAPIHTPSYQTMGDLMVRTRAGALCV